MLWGFVCFNYMVGRPPPSKLRDSSKASHLCTGREAQFLLQSDSFEILPFSLHHTPKSLGLQKGCHTEQANAVSNAVHYFPFWEGVPFPSCAFLLSTSPATTVVGSAALTTE